MSEQSPIKYFISGGFGGVCTVLVGVSSMFIKMVTTSINPTNSYHTFSTRSTPSKFACRPTISTRE